jgi:hypothetical protein
MTAAMPRSGPWPGTQVAGVVVADLVGGVLLAVSWYGASGSSRVDTQIAWTNLGVAGAVFLAAVNAMWLVAGRREVALRCRTLYRAASSPLPPAVALGAGPAPMTPGPGAEQFLASDSMRWYHRPDCLCAAGKAVQASGRHVHEEAGRTACRVCRP